MKRRVGIFLSLLLIFSAAAVSHGQSSAGSTTDSIALGLQPAAENLTAPVALIESPDGTGRLFIADQIGVIRVLTPGGMLPEPFLDLRESVVRLNTNYDERGLLGLAFHPNFAQNRRFFVYYSAPLREEAPRNWDHTSHISEFRISADNPNKADRNSERNVLQVDPPQSNHNGGTIAFGFDGLFYIALGDGGGANDTGIGHADDWYNVNPGGNGQNITRNLLGKILRIDVDNGNPYGIPPDNPFVGREGMDEIFAFGLRNPYRFSFDTAGSHALIAGDVGQNLWEEVDVIVKGGNYGWNVKEGAHCFNAANPVQPLSTCPNADPDGNRLIDPVIEYLNSNRPGGIGLAVIGGHIYRGSALPQLSGQYIFGDWSSSSSKPDGLIFVARPQREGMWPVNEVRITSNRGGKLGHFVLGFGQDSAGEVYVLTTDSRGPTGSTGKVFKLVAPVNSQ